MRFCFTCFFVLFLASGLRPQSEQQRAPTIEVVRGQVSAETGTLPAGLLVEIRSVTDHGPPQRTTVTADGDFRFRGLQAGAYEVRIDDMRGQTIYQGLVRLERTGEPLQLQIPQQSAAPVAPGTYSGVISVRQLLRRIPSKAAKEFRRSQKAFEAGDTPTSIEHLEKAIRIYPDYADAHNNLGARYVGLGQYERATSELQKAVALDPECAACLVNLSSALGALRRYPEAEGAARRALKLDSNSVLAHLNLGQALAAQEKNTPEAREHLQKAVGQFPEARLPLARVLVRRGAITEAVAELREYLKSGNSRKRELVESWLTRLSEAQR